MAGKGDMPRPYDRKRYEEGFARIDWTHHKNETSVSDSELIAPISKGGETNIYNFDLLKEEQKKLENSMLIPAHLLTGNRKEEGGVGHG